MDLQFSIGAYYSYGVLLLHEMAEPLSVPEGTLSAWAKEDASPAAGYFDGPKTIRFQKGVGVVLLGSVSEHRDGRGSGVTLRMLLVLLPLILRRQEATCWFGRPYAQRISTASTIRYHFRPPGSGDAR